MKNVRLGLIGYGNMGAVHAGLIRDGKAPGLELTAVAESAPERTAGLTGPRIFATPEELLASGLVDAVLIATPHPTHVELGLAALKAGLHLLVEKPIAIHKADAQRLVAAARRRPRQVFGVVLNQRTDPYFRKIRDLVRGGRLGAVRRFNWTVTDWFRPEAYYRSGGWRATWAGEGGGVLLNQSTHNLDLILWIFGRPKRVRAQCQFGRYHAIEVEDDVAAHLEFPHGLHAEFITSTGEAPGTNRLEIAADGGRLVYERDTLQLLRNTTRAAEFSRTSRERFAAPPTAEEQLAGLGHGGQHAEILANFAAAIREGIPLLAPGADGVGSVELANAMLLSAWTDRPVDLPLDGELFARWLRKKVRASGRKGRT